MIRQLVWELSDHGLLCLLKGLKGLTVTESMGNTCFSDIKLIIGTGITWGFAGILTLSILIMILHNSVKKIIRIIKASLCPWMNCYGIDSSDTNEMASRGVQVLSSMSTLSSYRSDKSVSQI